MNTIYNEIVKSIIGMVNNLIDFTSLGNVNSIQDAALMHLKLVMNERQEM